MLFASTDTCESTTSICSHATGICGSVGHHLSLRSSFDLRYLKAMGFNRGAMPELREFHFPGFNKSHPFKSYLSQLQATQMANHGILRMRARVGDTWNVSLARLELEDKSQQ